MWVGEESADVIALELENEFDVGEWDCPIVSHWFSPASLIQLPLQPLKVRTDPDSLKLVQEFVTERLDVRCDDSGLDYCFLFHREHPQDMLAAL
jgi:hypothetical protein